MPLTSSEILEVQSAYDTVDVSIIDSIVYFDGWKSYEECGGILVFVGIDGSTQLAEYGTSVFSSESMEFLPREVTAHEAYSRIAKMRAFLLTYDWPEY